MTVYLLEMWSEMHWCTQGVYSSRRLALEAAEEMGISEQDMGLTEWELDDVGTA